LHASLPWRDDTGILSCFVTITVSIDINTPFQSQVWARGLGQGLTNIFWIKNIKIINICVDLPALV